MLAILRSALFAVSLAVATSAAASAPDPARTEAYIDNAWNTLTRSMDDCSAVADDKVTTRPVLYLPADLPRTPDITETAKRCKVDVRVLPRALHQVGELDPRSLPAQGLLYLPNPYVVPGGFFNEMYGWDSYFIVLGLIADKREALARGMVDNFLFQVQHYGGVLNANRTYYLTRSQPPFLGEMIRAVLDAPASFANRREADAWLAHAYPLALRDYATWTRAEHRAGDTGMARYFDYGTGPVLEMRDADYLRGVIDWLLAHPDDDPGYLLKASEHPDAAEAERLKTTSCDVRASEVCEDAWAKGHRLSADYYLGDRAMRESGFDVNFHFGPFAGSTHHYAPVDLNSLLYRYELDLQHFAQRLGKTDDARRFERAAAVRKAAMDKYLWRPEAGMYLDYDFVTGKPATDPYITTFYPLWAGAASPQQALALRGKLALFEHKGGLAMSRHASGAQWDAPFGWAPTNWLAVAGLDAYGFHDDARRIARKFTATIDRSLADDGTIREKYNMVSGNADVKISAGYADNVIGFGWSNGVYLKLRQLLDGTYATPILSGISNQGENKQQPYVTAGDRTYLIGTQDGTFPDMGQHVPGEMGGLWLHPIKLIDGFRAQVTDAETDKEIVLSESAEMISYPYGNRFGYGPVLDDLEVERFQFSPDHQQGLIVQYSFKNASDRKRRLRFRWSVKTDLRPGWYSDSLGIRDGEDVVDWHSKDGIFIARDIDNPWFCVWGATPSADAQRIDHPLPIHTSGRGVTAASRYSVSVDPLSTATLTFVLSGSATDQDAAVETYDYLAKHHVALLAKKVAHYDSIINRARIRIPDPRLQEVYNWVRVNMAWLVRDVPGIGRGLGGGFMEYPWWFGTETYSLQALTTTGDFDLAKQTLRLLRSQSMKTNANGRIVHEVTTDGAVSNPGNTQETAQFILTAGKVVEWTGDLSFAKEMYPAMKLGIDWLLGDMDQDKNLFPEGYGIMEVYGLNAELIDVAVYTQQALEATARVAGLQNDPDAADRYQRLAAELKARINERFWIEEDGSYADFYGSRQQAISAAEGAIKQIGLKGADKLTRRDQELIGYYEELKAKFSAMPDGSRGWLTNKNWVITTPMETGIAPKTRAIRLLDGIRRENSGEYGPFLSAVERQAMMTISTGVQAVSEGKYGRTDEAMWYVDRIVQTFNRVLPGSISEMMPDYGCFTIAWTSYGVVVPLIEHVFGIRPDAINKAIEFDPHLPAGWEDISIEDLPVGTNLVSFSRARTASGIEYDIEAKENGWRFVLKGKALPGAQYFLNGRPVAFTSSGIRMSGKKNRVLVISSLN